MNNKGTTSDNKQKLSNRINLDYDFNTEYGDGDIPDIDKNESSDNNEKNVTSYNKNRN